MRRVIYVLILGLLFFAPVDRLDVADLELVQAVALYLEDGLVVLETDTGDVGKGKVVAEALEDMKGNTASVIYLDTAELLLVAEDAYAHVEAMRELLAPSVMVGRYRGGDVAEEAKYEDIHGQLTKLRDW